MVLDHPYRLRSLVVDDFKSIRHAEVELLPLSIIVGANSSGKSSLMQVILAISQAVRSRSAGATFPLNASTHDSEHSPRPLGSGPVAKMLQVTDT